MGSPIKQQKSTDKPLSEIIDGFLDLFPFAVEFPLNLVRYEQTVLYVFSPATPYRVVGTYSSFYVRVSTYPDHTGPTLSFSCGHTLMELPSFLSLWEELEAWIECEGGKFLSWETARKEGNPWAQSEFFVSGGERIRRLLENAIKQSLEVRDLSVLL